MKRPMTLACVTTTMIVMTITMYASATLNGETPSFRPIAEVEDLMHLNKKINGTLRERLREPPNWESAGRKARLLAEIANVLQYHKSPDESDWWTFAGMFRDGARKIAAAVEKKDLAEARASMKAMSVSCKQCHKKYRK